MGNAEGAAFFLDQGAPVGGGAQRVRTAWVCWLRTFDWDWWATPSFHYPVTSRQALDAVNHRGPWVSRKHGTPQDVAEVVTFLCSDEARNVTGAVIPVHGAPD